MVQHFLIDNPPTFPFFFCQLCIFSVLLFSSQFHRPFMNSSGWTTGLHLTLRPPAPFNMSLPLLLSLRIALFLHLSLPIPLYHYVHILIAPFSSSPRFHPFLVLFFSPLVPPLTFSSLASLLFPMYIFPPCFPDHKVVMKCKINMAVTF